MIERIAVIDEFRVTWFIVCLMLLGVISPRAAFFVLWIIAIFYAMSLIVVL